MEERLKQNDSDVLLDPKDHPIGSRLLVTNESPFYSSSKSSLAEAIVVEWAESQKRVKLNYQNGNTCWAECWNYRPIVVEILPPKTSQPHEEVLNSTCLSDDYIEGFYHAINLASALASNHAAIYELSSRWMVRDSIENLKSVISSKKKIS